MKTIADVLAKLETIIGETQKEQTPLGYFAALYYNMTREIQRGIANGVFENGSRMERLDVLFASRYFEAYDAWKSGSKPTGSWQVAFETAGNPDASVLQHLLLGINAHINLDLGIAAAQTRPGDAIFGLKKDFEKVNDIIAGLTDRVQDRLAEICLPFRFLDRFLKTADEGWINFSIHMARSNAWRVARDVALAKEKDAETQYIDDLDKMVTHLARTIARPPGRLLRWTLFFMRRGESGDAAKKIDILRAL